MNEVEQTSGRQPVIAIGGSAGALHAVKDLLGELPATFAAPIVLALHSLPESRLAELLQLDRRLKIDIRQATDGDALTPGTVHVVPGARHGLFSGNRLKISEPVEGSGFRPSIDALFMTLATEHGPNAIAVVLSGTMKDGMRGAQVIYDMGGKTVVQDPGEAAYGEMPRSVINADHPNDVLTAEDIGIWLTSHVEKMTTGTSP